MNRLSISKRLFIAFALIFIIIGAAVIYVWMSIQDVQREMQIMYQDQQLTVLLLEQEVLVKQGETAVDNYIMHQDQLFIEDYNEYSYAFSQLHNEASELFRDEEMKQIYEQYLNTKKAYDELFLNTFVPVIDQGRQADIERIDELIGQKEDDMSEALDYLTEALTLQLEHSYKLTEQELSLMVLRFLGGIGVAILISVIIGYFITRSITGPLKRVVQVTDTIAQGDLSIEIKENGTKDETGQLIKSVQAMLKNMKELINQSKITAEKMDVSSKEMNESAQQTGVAAKSITTSIQEVANVSDSQLHRSEEIARAMEEMAVGIQKVAETSSQVAESTSDMSNKAADGQEAIQRAVQQMSDIKDDSKITRNVIQKLQQESQEIGQIINLITEIAEQTNLLALNAAIEAARAGEAGKGFTVVADEIRKLADQTGQSAAKVGELISSIQANTGKAYDATTAGGENISTGIKTVNAAGQSFNNILKAVQQTAHDIQELSAIAQEMSASTEEVTASVQHMADSSKDVASQTQTVAASTEEQLAGIEGLSQSTQTLAHQAKELSQQLNKFKI